MTSGWSTSAPALPWQSNTPPKQTHLCVLIDDHSRLVPHAAYYPREDNAAFHDCLKCAIRKRGLPHRLYTDNGGAFVSNHSKQICARIGVQLLHARPYHSWSKGKVEKMIGTIQLGFEECVQTLSELNRKLQHWLDEIYHKRKHRNVEGALGLAVCPFVFDSFRRHCTGYPLAGCSPAEPASVSPD